MAIEIVRARPDQAARLTQIAHAAKSYWGYPAQWIELWHNQLTITSAYIAANAVWVAADEDQVVLGFYALTGAGERLNLEHMWVQPQSFGAGVGSMLFRHAVEQAQALGARMLEIEADPNAEGFYQKLGAETVGEVTYDLEGDPRTLPLMVYWLAGRQEPKNGVRV